MPVQMLIPLSQHSCDRQECFAWPTTMFPHLGQGSGGRPVAEKPHAGKYREVTLPRHRGGRGALTLSLTLWLNYEHMEQDVKLE